MSSRLQKLRRLPIVFGAFLLMSLLCLVLRENFPFSHFPMYKSFGDYTYIVYVVDKEGNPIPIETISAVRTGRLKKIYNQVADQERKRRKAIDPAFKMQDLTATDLEPAGRHALEWLVANCKENGKATLEELRPLGIHHVGIREDEGGQIQNYDFLVVTEEAAP